MHAQSVRTLSRLLVTLAVLCVVIAACPRALAAQPPDALAVNAPPASPVPERLLQWEFSYKGRRVKAAGTVLTRAEPLPDGTYEIVSISGKRNKRGIERLVPHGELMTMYGLLFSDNRLWTQPPYLTQSGFTFRTGSGVYFNVCYTGPYEGCGDVTHRNYRPGYYETDFRGELRPIEFTVRRTSTVVVAIVQPLEQDLPLDVIRTCDSQDVQRNTGALAAAGTMAAFSPPEHTGAVSTNPSCAVPELERNRL